MDIAVDKVAAFIDRVRGYDVKEGVTDEDSGSNAIDDGMTDVLVDTADDPTERELRDFIAALNVDERANLVALVWIGRGDYEAEEWDEALAAARERRDGSTWRYLLGIPNVGDLLDEGLAAMTEDEDLPPARDDEQVAAAPEDVGQRGAPTD